QYFTRPNKGAMVSLSSARTLPVRSNSSLRLPPLPLYSLNISASSPVLAIAAESRMASAAAPHIAQHERYALTFQHLAASRARSRKALKNLVYGWSNSMNVSEPMGTNESSVPSVTQR